MLHSTYNYFYLYIKKIEFQLLIHLSVTLKHATLIYDVTNICNILKLSYNLSLHNTHSCCCNSALMQCTLLTYLYIPMNMNIHNSIFYHGNNQASCYTKFFAHLILLSPPKFLSIHIYRLLLVLSRECVSRP